MDLKNARFEDNKTDGRYELHLNGSVAIIKYEDEGEKVILIHTEVPETLEGNGVAGTLVERTFEYLEQDGKKVVAACSYVRNFLRNHKEWGRIEA